MYCCHLLYPQEFAGLSGSVGLQRCLKQTFAKVSEIDTFACKATTQEGGKRKEKVTRMCKRGWIYYCMYIDIYVYCICIYIRIYVHTYLHMYTYISY